MGEGEREEGAPAEVLLCPFGEPRCPFEELRFPFEGLRCPLGEVMWPLLDPFAFSVVVVMCPFPTCPTSTLSIAANTITLK